MSINQEANTRPRLKGVRRALTLTLVGLALFVLFIASLIEIATLFGFGISEGYPGARYDVAGYAAIFVWLPALFLACLLSITTLFLAHQYRAIRYLLVASALIALISLVAIFQAIPNVPIQGLTALLLCLVFLVINAAAVYVAWRFTTTIGRARKRA